MRFVQYPNGYSAQGRQAANQLQSSPLESVTKRTLDGTRVKRNGDFTKVLAQPNELGDMLAIGRNSGGVLRIYGSRTGLGTWRERGPGGIEGMDAFDNTAMYLFGQRRALLVAGGYTGPSEDLDFAGGGVQKDIFRVARTRTGASQELRYDIEANAPAFVPGLTPPAVTAYFQPPTISYVAGALKFSTGAYFTILLSDGQYAPVFLRDDGETWTLGGTLYVPGQMQLSSTPLFLAPGVNMKIDRIPRGNPTSPGLAFQVTEDSGISWAGVAEPAIFTPEMDTIRALGSGGGDVARFNQAVANASVISAPLSRATSVVVATLPYIDGADFKVRVKLGLMDVAARTIVQTAELFDGAYAEGITFVRSALAIGGGVLIATRPDGGGTSPAHLQFTTDGVSLVDVGDMPLGENRTGQINAISPRTLVCPMFDGQYKLFASRDLGFTWTAQSLITASGQAPDLDPTRLQLEQFGYVVFTRRGAELSSNPYPATPWLTDIRVAEPTP